MMLMSNTVYDFAMQRAVNELCQTDDGMLCIAKYRRGLKFNKYATHQNWIVQRSGGYVDEDALAFAKIHAMLGSGQIAHCAIKLDAEPARDSDIETNRAVIAALSDYSWQDGDNEICMAGDVWCGLEQDDGVINTTTPAPFTVWRGDPSTDTTTSEKIYLEPSQFPLEIGYTTAARSLFHLLREKALARWCYHSNDLILLKVI